jgi:hypothetical protein
MKREQVMDEQRGKALVGLPSVFLFFYELA